MSPEIMRQQRCVDIQFSPNVTRPSSQSKFSVCFRCNEDCLVDSCWSQGRRPHVQSIRSLLLSPGRNLSATATFLIVSLLLMPASSRRSSAYHYSRRLRTRNIQETDYGILLRVRVPEFSILIQPTPTVLNSTQAEEVRYYSESIISDYVMNVSNWAVDGSSLVPQFFKTSSVSEVKFVDGDGSDILPSSEVIIRGAVISFDASADTDSLYLPSETEFQSIMSVLLFPPNNTSSGLIAELQQVGSFGNVTGGRFSGQLESIPPSTAPTAALPSESPTTIPSRGPTLAPIVRGTANKGPSVSPISSVEPATAPSTQPTVAINNTRSEDNETSAGNGQGVNSESDAAVAADSSASSSTGGGKAALIGGAVAGVLIVGLVSWLFVNRWKSARKLKDDTINMNGAKVKELRDLDALGKSDVAEDEEDTVSTSKIALDLAASNIQDDSNGSSAFFDSSELLWEADDSNVMKIDEGMKAYALSSDGEKLKVNFDDISSIDDSDSDRHNMMLEHPVESFESQANRMTVILRKDMLNQPLSQLAHEGELKGKKKKKGRLVSSYFSVSESSEMNNRRFESNNNPHPYQDRRKHPHAKYLVNTSLENASVSSHSDFVNIEFEPDLDWDPNDNEADPVLIATSLDTSFAHATSRSDLHNDLICLVEKEEMNATCKTTMMKTLSGCVKNSKEGEDDIIAKTVNPVAPYQMDSIEVLDSIENKEEQKDQLRRQNGPVHASISL